MDQSDADKPDISLFTSSNVISSTGESVPLSTLFRPSSIVILTFIRHFSCGACMSFVQALSEQISLDELAKASASIVIIGNGDHKHIEDYAKMTKCPFTIYTDPMRDLFKKLDLGSMKMSNPSTPEPSYSNRNVLGDTMLALQTFVKMGTFSTGGDFKQLGGDYVFQTDETGKTTCIFARKMPNSRSHTAPETLKQVISGARS